MASAQLTRPMPVVQFKNAEGLPGKVLMLGANDQKVKGSQKSTNKVIYELPEEYNMYSNVSVSSDSGVYYMVMDKEGGKVYVASKASREPKGDYYLTVNFCGQLVKTYPTGSTVTKGKHLKQSDDYVLTVTDDGDVKISDGTNEQTIDLPW